MGGKIKHAISGGARLGERLGQFFCGVDSTVPDGYGLAETAGATTGNKAAT